MVRTCPRCRRVNPTGAAYCHFDGAALDAPSGSEAGRPIDLGARPFRAPFVMPGGQSCANYAELAAALLEHPKAATDLLRAGHLEPFLGAEGRADLAQTARLAGKSADPERGLDDFLGRLPVKLPAAKLRVEPREIDLGAVQIGEDRRFELKLKNDGKRLLHGTVDCEDVPWLALGERASVRKVFRFVDRMTLTVRVVGRALHAYRQSQQAEIQIHSNGGEEAVIVRLRVSAQPFPDGILAGALSPRQLAEKAREAPKEAAALIENGAVARWYQANGWTYPVQGPSALGVAAVQQFFEALGLVKPPVVELSQDAIALRGAPGQRVEHVLTALTHENRAVVAHAVSDQPWLTIGATTFRGKSAFLPLTIASVPGRLGETLSASITVTANGLQRFVVPVTLTVAEAIAPVPRTPAAPELAPKPRPMPVAPRPTTAPVGEMTAPVAAPRRGPWMLVLGTLLLLGTAGGAVVRDFLVPPPPAPVAPTLALDSTPRIEVRFHDALQGDELEKIWLAGAGPTMRFGIVTLQNGKAIGTGAQARRLTFDPLGRTNNVCVRFDGKDERLFGGPGGVWEERAEHEWKEADGDHQGTRSAWICDDKKIAIAQFVELVRGSQSRLLDTCRVRYRIENRDAVPREVGLRFLLDTFIGGNDGVPFTIPGAAKLCDTHMNLPAEATDKKVPDFLEALEKADLAQPGTVAHLRLALEGIEPPIRVTLGAWPNEKLRVLDRKALGPSTLWDVPVLPLKSLGLDDSAVTLYWKEGPLAPGASRTVGFEYGLQELARRDGKLATSIDGAYRPGGEITVIAYIEPAAAEGEITLTVPEGFESIEGALNQPVPKAGTGAAAGMRYVPITWRIRAGAMGTYDLVVRASTGESQTIRVEIRKGIY
jgi:hypothetical protein